MKKDESTKPQGESKYAKKRASGNMMYGPGCRAHDRSSEHIERIKREASRVRRVDNFNALVSMVERGEHAHA